MTGVQLADVHLDLGVTVTGGVVAIVLLVGYWIRLGHDDVPELRRRVRRCSVIAMIATTMLLVAALSVHDPDVRPRWYVWTWIAVLGLVCTLVVTAILDAIVSVRLGALARNRDTVHLGDDLKKAISDYHERARQSDDDGRGDSAT